MEELLNTIGNKKLISSFKSNDMITFSQVLAKLYKKARRSQDKIEFLLVECIKYSRGEKLDIQLAWHNFNNIKCHEFALKSRSQAELSERYLIETDALIRFNIKESAYQNAYDNCMNTK